MDWVQIYVIIMVALNFVMNAVQNGDKVENEYFGINKFFWDVVGAIPLIGRIFGWW